jgi:L-lactate dehydrogenase
VDARSVHGFIVGEHGDSEVPVWSLTNIAGMRLPEYIKHNNANCSPQQMDDIFIQTRDAAYEIIKRKGATYYAIGAGLMSITEAILRDQSTVLSVSSLVKGDYGISGVYLSLPTVLHRGGVERVIHLELSAGEEEKLQDSARVLLETIAGLNGLT